MSSQSPDIHQSNTAPRQSRERNFVQWVATRCAQDNSFRSQLSKAESSNTQAYAWPLLASFGVDLENPWEREPYAIIGALVAKSRSGSVGGLPLGRAILASYGNDKDSPPAQARLRRLLAASTGREAGQVIKPIVKLALSRGVDIDFGGLLEDLIRFDLDPEKVKARWANSFYRYQSDQTSASSEVSK